MKLSTVCSWCSWFQPSSDTILQETVRREALNGVYDIDTVKVVTPAVLVRLYVYVHLHCVYLPVCVCVRMCVCILTSMYSNQPLILLSETLAKLITTNQMFWQPTAAFISV